MILSYFRKVGVLAVAQFILRMKALLILPLLTRHFGAADYGIWSQVTVIVMVMSPMIMMGMDSAAVRFLPGSSRREKARGISSILVIAFLLTLGVSLILWAVDDVLALAFFGGAEYAQFVAISGLVILSGLTVSILRTWFRIEDNAIALSLSLLTVAIAGSAAVVAAVVMGWDIRSLVLSTALFEAVPSIALLIYAFKRYGIGMPELRTIKRFVRFGILLVPGAYATWVLTFADRLFIIRYGSIEDLGIYNLVYSLGFILTAMFFRPFRAMYPSRASELFNQGDMVGLNRLFVFSSGGALALAIPAVVGFSILAVPILTHLSTEDFVPGATLVPFVALGYVFHIYGSYFGVNLLLADKTRTVFALLLIASVANLVLNAVLIPIWGILGAAIATNLSLFVHMVMTMRKASQFVTLDIERVFILKILVATALMGLAVYFSPTGSLLQLVIAIFIGMFVYAGAIILLNVFALKERMYLLQSIRPNT